MCRLCTLTLARLVLFQSLDTDLNSIIIAVKMQSSKRTLRYIVVTEYVCLSVSLFDCLSVCLSLCFVSLSVCVSQLVSFSLAVSLSDSVCVSLSISLWLSHIVLFGFSLSQVCMYNTLLSFTLYYFTLMHVSYDIRMIPMPNFQLYDRNWIMLTAINIVLFVSLIFSVPLSMCLTVCTHVCVWCPIRISCILDTRICMFVFFVQYYVMRIVNYDIRMCYNAQLPIIESIGRGI